ncbi:HNH endonuclease [Arthrobacter sp. I2-34]|uniref:HNH endonuclease n=1 Tax=Arthrobacter hankyongi TaxID=2904801 RepID=A0ABS9L4W8_9MICC|nr:HNH endonuclease signature motif containing protein [Arthrobacter hankyongi]MCG2621724.1 HNH endonuclease [Arthrobacter hankyongi]
MLELCAHQLLLDAWAGQLNLPDSARLRSAPAAWQEDPPPTPADRPGAEAADARPASAPHPAVDLARQLAALDISALDDSETIDFLTTAARLERMAQSLIAKALHRFTVLRPATGNEAGAADGFSRFAAGEIVAALAMGEAAARKQLADAAQICTHLPDTLAAMTAGDLDLPRAVAIARGSADLPAGILPEFEKAVVPGAGTITKEGVQARARTARHRLHPEDLEVRHKRAFETRDVAVVPQDDGMAELWIRTGADKAFLIYDRVQALARSLQGPGESRTLPQLRADALTDLMAGCGTPACSDASGEAPASTLSGASKPPGGGPATEPVATAVAVTLPLETAAGLSNEPGDLVGYGPITAGQARELASLAKAWLPVLTDDHGRAVAAARALRIPPAWLKRLVRLRDRHCRFPGCRRAAARCETDHIIAWDDGGDTTLENLQCLCKAHHRAKHHGGWKASPGPNGRICWTARTGHRYSTDPDEGWDISWPRPPGPGKGTARPDAAGTKTSTTGAAGTQAAGTGAGETASGPPERSAGSGESADGSGHDAGQDLPPPF